MVKANAAGGCPIAKAFQKFDADKNGQVSPAELLASSKASGMASDLKQAEAMVKSMDADKNGMIGLTEYKQAFAAMSK